MDQIKIGSFLKELRKEKGLTQDGLAVKLNVARRTVSRWETGYNLPDLDILIELSDFYGVDLRELLNGERTEKKMDKELKDTVLQVAEYSNEEKKKSSKIVLIYFVIGIIALFINLLVQILEMEDSFLTGFIKGSTFGAALGSMILGIIFVTGRMEKMREFKMRLIGKGGENE